jgi:hypothetical protein
MVSAGDEAILNHIGRYRLTLREVLADAFGLKHPGNILQRLRDAGLIVERRGTDDCGLPGRVSYYQLTAAGACDRVSSERARPMKPEALRQHLAVLWYCHFGTSPAVRLEESQMQDLFGAVAPNARQVAYCLGDDAGTKRLLRVHVPGEAVPAARVVKTVHAIVSELARTDGEVASWVAAQTLGVLVLADSPERTALIEAAVTASELRRIAHVAVAAAATPRTLLRLLTARRTAESYPSSSQSGPSRM